eukprot:3351465-Rhodomonas_salina.1
MPRVVRDMLRRAMGDGKDDGALSSLACSPGTARPSSQHRALHNLAHASGSGTAAHANRQILSQQKTAHACLRHRVSLARPGIATAHADPISVPDTAQHSSRRKRADLPLVQTLLPRSGRSMFVNQARALHNGLGIALHNRGTAAAE